MELQQLQQLGSRTHPHGTQDQIRYLLCQNQEWRQHAANLEEQIRSTNNNLQSGELSAAEREKRISWLQKVVEKLAETLSGLANGEGTGVGNVYVDNQMLFYKVADLESAIVILRAKNAAP